MNRLLAIASLALLQLPGIAHASGDDHCSTHMLVGRWVFATGIGHQALGLPPPPGDVTALGTMNIKRNGTLEGVFDVTFQDFEPGPLLDVPYSGTVSVNEDCTGTLHFVTGAGTERTDSIVVVSRYEFWGMSLVPGNLWTYQARRLSGRMGYWSH